jgi:hypothetical protein
MTGFRGGSVRRFALLAVIVGLVGCLWAPAALGFGAVPGSTSVGPPTATIAQPATGGTYNLKQQVATSFSCAAPTGGSLKSCVDSNGATGGTGALNTSTTGSHSYTVTATDDDGQTGTKSITYTVAGPPTVRITAPASGQAYEPGQAVSTNFTCTEATGGPGIAKCTDSNGSGSPGRLDTSVAGTHSYTVTATSQDAQSTTAKFSYLVIGRPSAKIVVPAVKQLFRLGHPAATSFSCKAAFRGPQISSCLDSAGHVSPGALDTSKAGRYVYSVTAKAADNQSATATAVYFVAAPPTATISVPARNASYTRGSRVLAAYACKEGAEGPGLSACTGPAVDGAPIDTSVIGRHTFLVTAISGDGQRGATEAQYTVTPPSNDFKIAHLKLGRKGWLRLSISVPGPGVLSLRETAPVSRHGHRTFVFARRHRGVARAGVLRLTIRPNGRGRRYVRHLNRRLALKLYISYTPDLGVVRHRGPFTVRAPRRR